MSFDDVANRMRARHQEGMIPQAHAPEVPHPPVPRAYIRPPHQAAPPSQRNNNLIFGALLIVIGVVITTVTYDSASREGGTYIVAWGPIAVGVVRVIKGLAG